MSATNTQSDEQAKMPTMEQAGVIKSNLLQAIKKKELFAVRTMSFYMHLLFCLTTFQQSCRLLSARHGSQIK